MKPTQEPLKDAGSHYEFVLQGIGEYDFVPLVKPRP